MKNEYENFAEDCYDKDIDLNTAMEKEIACIVDGYKIFDRDLHEQVKKIMRLIHAVRYEW